MPGKRVIGYAFVVARREPTKKAARCGRPVCGQRMRHSRRSAAHHMVLTLRMSLIVALGGLLQNGLRVPERANRATLPARRGAAALLLDLARLHQLPHGRRGRLAAILLRDLPAVLLTLPLTPTRGPADPWTAYVR